MRRLALAQALVLVPVLAPCAGCDPRAYVKNGFVLDKDHSVFTRYSGDYCRVEGKGGGGFSTNCENLARFVDPASEACSGEHAQGFTPERAYFPDETRPMRLCRDRAEPGRTAQTVVRFAVFGDNGAGDDVAAGEAQTSVAEALAAVCPARAGGAPDPADGDGARACDFALIVGDVIYPRGIESVFDPILAARFEDVYRRNGALPFYVLPGNHDYGGNVTAMTEYTHFSDRWIMPARHFAVPDLPPWLALHGLDTSALTGDDGAANDAATQRAELDEGFCASSGWRVLAGHFPPLSHGAHGGHDATARALSDLHASCPFNLYLAGHDHDQEALSTDRYEIAVQGGGGAALKTVTELAAGTIEARPELGFAAVEQRYARTAHGFTVVEATETTLELHFFDVDRWRFGKGGFAVQPRFADAAYRCRMTRGEAGGCKAF